MHLKIDSLHFGFAWHRGMPVFLDVGRFRLFKVSRVVVAEMKEKNLRPCGESIEKCFPRIIHNFREFFNFSPLLWLRIRPALYL